MSDAISAMNMYSMDPLWLAYAQSNPSFGQAQALGGVQSTGATPQTLDSGEAQTTTATGIDALPQADYSDGSSSTGLLVGGTVAAGAAALICGIKGKGSVTKGAKMLWDSLRGKAGKVAGKTLGGHKTDKLDTLKVVMKNGQSVYYVPGKTTTRAVTAAESAQLMADKEIKALTGLRIKNGETNITGATFNMKHGDKNNIVTFSGDKIVDIRNSEGKSILAEYVENGKLKEFTDADKNDFVRVIQENIEKIKGGDKDFILGKDSALSDIYYTTRVGDNAAKVYRKGIQHSAGTPEIRELTTLKEYSADSDAVKAYIRDSRLGGKDIGAITSNEFLKKHKLPSGLKIQQMNITKGNDVIKIVNGKPQGVTIGGQYYGSNTDKFKAYLEDNEKSINDTIQKIMKGDKIPKTVGDIVIVPA